MLLPETVKGVVHDCHYTAGLDAVHVVLFEVSVAKWLAEPPNDSAAVTPYNVRCTAAVPRKAVLIRCVNTVLMTAISHG